VGSRRRISMPAFEQRGVRGGRSCRLTPIRHRRGRAGNCTPLGFWPNRACRTNDPIRWRSLMASQQPAAVADAFSCATRMRSAFMRRGCSGKPLPSSPIQNFSGWGPFEGCRRTPRSCCVDQSASIGRGSRPLARLSFQIDEEHREPRRWRRFTSSPGGVRASQAASGRECRAREVHTFWAG